MAYPVESLLQCLFYISFIISKLKRLTFKERKIYRCMAFFKADLETLSRLNFGAIRE